MKDSARAGGVGLARVGVAGRRSAALVALVRAWARTRLVALSQAQNSCRIIAGVVERRIGPAEGPAPVMVDLFSLIVVSEPVHRHG